MSKTMIYLTSAYRFLHWIGVFSTSDSSAWSRWAFNVYRVFIFTVSVLITVLMTVQMFVATDLTTLARTIDIQTMLLSGIYKWFCMTVFSKKFAELSTDLIRIQAQGSVVYGKSANRFIANYLKPMDKIIFWYIMSGVAVIFFNISDPLFTFLLG